MRERVCIVEYVCARKEGEGDNCGLLNVREVFIAGGQAQSASTHLFPGLPLSHSLAEWGGFRVPAWAGTVLPQYCSQTQAGWGPCTPRQRGALHPGSNLPHPGAAALLFAPPSSRSREGTKGFALRACLLLQWTVAGPGTSHQLHRQHGLLRRLHVQEALQRVEQRGRPQRPCQPRGARGPSPPAPVGRRCSLIALLGVRQPPLAPLHRRERRARLGETRVLAHLQSNHKTHVDHERRPPWKSNVYAGACSW